METILTSISLGLLATTSPCILPLYPGFLAYLSGNQAAQAKRRYFLGLFRSAGCVDHDACPGRPDRPALGFDWQRARGHHPAGRCADPCPGCSVAAGYQSLQTAAPNPGSGVFHPFANAFVYGLLYGPIALPCSGPLVVGIFAFSLTAGEALSKLAVFFWFGSGLWHPAAGALAPLRLAAAPDHPPVRRAFAQGQPGGWLFLLGVGLYDLWLNREMLLAFFG